MRTLIIADDDRIILRGLSETIPWEAGGFRLAASETNGEDAWEAVVRERPQVVLTDIRMPFMDGLELTEKIKEHYPDTKIIMMTSYDEFEFAQKALKLKVFDFVLKPLDEAKLLDTVKRAAEEWEHEHATAKKVIEGIPLLKQRFCENLLTGKFTEEEIRHELDFLDIPLQAGHYAVILLLADHYYDASPRNRYGQELLKYCIHNVADEVVRLECGPEPRPGEPTGLVFSALKDEIVVIYGAEEDETALELQALTLAETIRANVETYLKTTVTAGVGSVVEKLDRVRDSYHSAKAATELRHMTGKNQVFLYRDDLIKPKADGYNAVGSDWAPRLTMKIKSGLEQEAAAILDGLEEEFLSRRPVDLVRMHMLGMEIVFSLVHAFQDWHEPPYAKGTVEGLFEEIHHYRTARDMFERIRDFMNDLSAAVKERRLRQHKSLADQAAAFIREHYMKEGLSLQDVADHVHVSTTYLSAIFKKETGINFSDFLLETRMNAAMDWLRKEELKTYEVAERVGYANPQYFSVIFKKFTGVTPSEFRHTR
ncbi:response regulator [Paenibacillus caseinilyticus]|uniref:AraC family transcriptional regulator n=1 Tax=Paenibacillus mucilaginosus K02 TaxID=997761 RepID=I0BLZ7_9BACL|nr:response regulator [Paenibacillus mucilaginosus]AFH63394.1 AraC family transcriptional regulator [Paenibacillus mucilaginosus K02]